MRCHMPLCCAAALALVCCVATCSREQSPDTPTGAMTASEQQEAITVKSGDGSVIIAGNDTSGQITITTGEGEDIAVAYTVNTLADGFPGDLPVYEPAQIAMSQVFNAGRNAVLTLTTSHSPERVAEYYRTELASRGWAVGGEMSVGDMVMLQGRKDGSALHFTALTVEGQTKINLAKTEADQ